MKYRFTSAMRNADSYVIHAEPTPEHLRDLNASIAEFSQKLMEKEELYMLDGLSVEALEELITQCKDAIDRKGRNNDRK